MIILRPFLYPMTGEIRMIVAVGGGGVAAVGDPVGPVVVILILSCCSYGSYMTV